MVNMWGVVDGNPGLIPAGATPTVRTLALPTGGTQTFANCSTAPLDLRRELSQVNPAVGITDTSIGSPMPGGRTTTGCCCRFSAARQAGSSRAPTTRSRRARVSISQGQAPLNVATGYMKPISMINPPSEAEQEAIFEEDKGRCSTWRKHIFNLSASIETPQFHNTTARRIASGWRLSGIYRANSGAPLTVSTGIDRALSGIQVDAAREPGARRSAR